MCLSFFRQNNYFIFEIFLFIRLAALFIPNVAKHMLVQDKICLVIHNQADHFCQNIHNDFNMTNEKHMKDKILSEATMFTNYESIIDSCGMVIWSLFVGSFLDKFSGGTILILALNIVSDLFSTFVYLIGIGIYHSNPYYLLIASMSSWFDGGLMSFSTTAFSYISAKTNEETRMVKFVALQVLFVIGIASSVFFGGQLLVYNYSSPQLRTYKNNLLLTLGLDVALIFLLIAFFFIERSASRNSCDLKKSSNISVDSIPGKYNSIINNRLSEVNIQSEESLQTTEKKGLLRTLFDLDNVKQTVNCFIRPRDHNIRLQIYLLFAVLFVQVLVTNGLKNILLQFAQKVYHWSATTYTTIEAVQQIAQTLLMGIFSVIFMKFLKLHDNTLVLIAQISTLLSDFVKGTILNPAAYYVSLPIGALSGFAAISVKTKLSKIVPENEVAKMFSLSSTIEALVPIAASLIYSNIFSLSISTYPGLIYICSCVLLLFSIVLLIFERCLCPVKSLKEYEEMLDNKQRA